MSLKKTKLKNVYINKLKNFTDHRGAVVETFIEKKFKKF